jgi:rubrerythrin
MPRWTPDDIPWRSFDQTKLDPDILQLVKAAALTEYNAADYTRYLENVFRDDAEFRASAREWQLEEEQHGRVLGRYAEMADPTFDFEDTFKRFKAGYVIPTDVVKSIRGSRVGELIARCVVETGTSSYYSALSEATDEPVLKEICKHVAADEFRHYRTFLDGARKYQPIENVSVARRIMVALGRFREANDDELAFAFHCANEKGLGYDHARANAAYAAKAYPLYRYHHVERGIGMVLKALGLKPNGYLGRGAVNMAWRVIKGRAAKAALA